MHPMHPMRPLARESTLRLTLGALLLAVALAASAHSKLVASQPAEGQRLTVAPAAIELRFNEPVQLTALTLVDAAGRRSRVALPADTTPRALERLPVPPLAAGAWRIEWRAISADGHPVRGSIRFGIQAQAGPAR